MLPHLSPCHLVASYPSLYFPAPEVESYPDADVSPAPIVSHFFNTYESIFEALNGVQAKYLGGRGKKTVSDDKCEDITLPFKVEERELEDELCFDDADELYLGKTNDSKQFIGLIPIESTATTHQSGEASLLDVDFL